MFYRDVAAIAFVGAVCGTYFGLTCGWQIAVESAQVVAGLVPYPADNPFYMYHVKSWTLLHQLPALLLKCGISESVLSMVVACTAAAMLMQALGLLCYAFCRDRLVACAVPLVYLATNVCKGCGAVYPVFIVPDEYWTSYGVTGSACLLLTWSLWGVGLRRPAALLSGIAPAVHPALGGWCVAIAGMAFVWQWFSERREPSRFAAATSPRLWPIVFWFSVGLAIAAASYLAQQLIARGLAAADPVLSRKLLEAFVEGWDNHRVPFPLGHIDCQYGWCLLTLTAAMHAWFAKQLPRASQLLLRILLLSAAGSLALCFLTHLAHWLPLEVMMAMPGRFINLAVLAYPAVLIGLLARGRRVWLIDGLLAGLSLYCLLRTLMLSKQLIYVPAAQKIFVATGLLFVYVLASRAKADGSAGARRLVRWGACACLVTAGYLWMRDLHLAVLVWLSVPGLWFSQRWLRRLDSQGVRQFLRLSTVACLWLAAMIKGGWLLGAGCCLAAAMAAHVLCSRKHAAKLWNVLRFPNFQFAICNLQFAMSAVIAAACLTLVALPLAERARAGLQLFSEAESDSVVQAARRESGMLLVVPRMCLVQLRTRRPVLLNGEAMNQITYVPQSGPTMNEIVKGIYGDDILKPRPYWWQNWGGLMAHSGYDLWQARQPAEWRRLSRAFGFHQIVTGREWKLQLPVVARSETLILYQVP